MYTLDGQKPVQSKITAIKEMLAPQCEKQVQSFIGMVNYLSKFSARLSELTKPIRELCKEKVPFNWGPEHENAFHLIKKEIVAAPILAYYNPKKLMVLQTDASCKGLGACLLQNQKPVYFTSRALSETQKGYVAIELKSLMVAWAMEKFHHFLYSNEFILKTNQKPLEAILLKSLNQATPRLQRILIRTFPYHFKVRYIPGLTNHVADCLSRLGFQKDSISLPKLHVNQITSQLKSQPANSHTGWWQTCDSQAHHPTGMAQDHQRSSASGTKILDLPWRTYNRRWVSAQRYMNHNTWQEKGRNSEIDTWRSPRP